MKLKFNCEYYDVWYKWFAWHPVFVDDTLVWLEYVERMTTCNFELYTKPFCTHYGFIK